MELNRKITLDEYLSKLTYDCLANSELRALLSIIEDKNLLIEELEEKLYNLTGHYDH